MANGVVTAEQQNVETGMVPSERSPQDVFQRTIIKAVAISVPVSIAFFVGLVALAVARQHPNWTGMMAMAAGLGLLAGVFFGLLAAFVLSSHLFD